MAACAAAPMLSRRSRSAPARWALDGPTPGDWRPSARTVSSACSISSTWSCGWPWSAVVRAVSGKLTPPGSSTRDAESRLFDLRYGINGSALRISEYALGLPGRHPDDQQFCWPRLRHEVTHMITGPDDTHHARCQ